MSETLTKEGFHALNLPANLLQKTDRLGFVTPTPIQEQAIPVALSGQDVIGIAQTGTGKTLAFALPMIVRLQSGRFGLVLAPTRELALQIQETFIKLGVRTALLIGGAPMGRQIRDLKSQPTVVIATPGRLADHLANGFINLHLTSIVVLDEADRMLDMGFEPTIRKILDRVPAARQTMLFSATMPKEIAELAKHYLRNPQRIEVSRQGTAAPNVIQELLMLSPEGKPDMLGDLLHEHRGTVLVFARTRYGARKVARSVRFLGHTAAELHSDRTLAQRTEALKGFKSGEYRVLVATDIAARGIDVKDIEVVINYDVPQNAEDYVHRIGRTGRAGASGRAITMATPDQHKDIRDIERLMKVELEMSPMSQGTYKRVTESPRGAARPAQGGAARRGPWRPNSGPARRPR